MLQRKMLQKKNAAKKMETKNNKKMTKKWMVENKGKPLLIPKSESVYSESSIYSIFIYR